MGAVKQPPKLEVVRNDFGQATHDLAHSEYYQQAPPELRALIDRMAETAINALEASQVAIEQPRYQNTYGPKFQHEQNNEIGELYEMNGSKTEHHHHNTTFNELRAEALPSEWIYWLSPNLIISTNGQFVFRPKDRKLITAVGEISLSEAEVTELFRMLKQDFKIRGTL